MKVRKGLLKYISPDSPEEARMRAARRLEPLSPEDELTVLFALSHDADPGVSGAALKSLEGYPKELVLRGLEKRLDPLVIKRLIALNKDDAAVLAMAAMSPGADDAILCDLAATGPDEVVAIFSEDRDRLSSNPALLEGLKKNPRAPKYLIREIESYIKNPAPPGQEAPPPLVPPAPPAVEKAPENMGLEEIGRATGDRTNIYKLIQNLSVAEKIKLALTGDKTARDLLVRDTNKVVSGAVLKNPRITEKEVAKVALSKNTSDEVLREISQKKEWMKNYSIKLSMVFNPKTPLTASLKMIDHLHDRDLFELSRSREVPGVLASTAMRRLEKKKRV